MLLFFVFFKAFLFFFEKKVAVQKKNIKFAILYVKNNMV